MKNKTVRRIQGGGCTELTPEPIWSGKELNMYLLMYTLSLLKVIYMYYYCDYHHHIIHKYSTYV